MSQFCPNLFADHRYGKYKKKDQTFNLLKVLKVFNGQRWCPFIRPLKSVALRFSARSVRIDTWIKTRSALSIFRCFLTDWSNDFQTKIKKFCIFIDSIKLDLNCKIKVRASKKIYFKYWKPQPVSIRNSLRHTKPNCLYHKVTDIVWLKFNYNLQEIWKIITLYFVWW